MSDKITDAELADVLGVLCDFVQDSTQCFNPWPDEELKTVRELISDLKLGNRPRSVFANSVNLQTFQTPRHQLNRDQIEDIIDQVSSMDLKTINKFYPLRILH